MLKTIYYTNNWDIKAITIMIGLITKKIEITIITLLILQIIYTTIEISKKVYKVQSAK